MQLGATQVVRTRPRPAIMATAALMMFLAGCKGSGPADAATPTPPPPSTAATPTPSVAPVAVTSFSCPAPGAAIDVCNATMDIPVWNSDGPQPDCPEKGVKLTNGLYPSARGNVSDGVVKFVIADVDRDGLADAVVLLSCQVGDPPTQQVMVVARTPAGGLHTLGQVVGQVKGGIEYVEDIGADPDGSIRALVAAPHGSVGGNLSLRQWRTYRWTGQQFVQSAGSTSFQADKTAVTLTATATPVAFAAAQGGRRRGTFTLTVKNTGTTLAKAVSVQFLTNLETPMDATSTQCPVGALIEVPTCTAGDLAPGASRTFTMGLSIATDDISAFQSNEPDGSPGQLRILLGDQEYSSKPVPRATF